MPPSPSVRLLLHQGGVSAPPPPPSFSPSNIFSSWSGTEHIMDGSVKVIILLGWWPQTIFLHLRVSVSLPILWIFYQLLNHGSAIGEVTCRAQWYENPRYQYCTKQGTQIWARHLNGMTKRSSIQPQQLPSGAGLASFCMHALPRNLSEKEIAAAQKSVWFQLFSSTAFLFYFLFFLQRWEVSRQQEKCRGGGSDLAALRESPPWVWEWPRLFACLRPGRLMVWAPAEPWWWAVWRWERWRRPTWTTFVRRKHHTR